MCQSKTLRGSESHGSKVSRLFPFHPLVGLSSEPLKVVMSAKPEDSCSRIFGEEEEEDLLVLTHHHKQIKLFYSSPALVALSTISRLNGARNMSEKVGCSLFGWGHITVKLSNVEFGFDVCVHHIHRMH